MTDLDKAAQPTDGRVARRERNVNAVIDVVLELFAEESLFPTIEQAAKRSGLSLRSLYRYFADPAELLEATIITSRERAAEASKLPSIGQGPFEKRVDDFVDMRLRVYDEFGAVYRATSANAARLPRIAKEQAYNCDEMRRQFELQFAPELAAHPDSAAALSAGDLLTQIASIDFLCRHRELPTRQVRSVLTSSLHALLT